MENDITSSKQPRKKRVWTGYGVVAFVLIILLILAALTSATTTSLRSAACKTATATWANEIATACLNYQTEHFVLPPSSENSLLTKYLCGDNPRKIEFLSLTKYQVNSNHEMIDPWGTPFRIIFKERDKYPVDIDVISAGPDKIFDTPDDIINP